MFTGEVDVSKTNIFVARVGAREQLTVYSNTVALPGRKNAYSAVGLWGDGTPQAGGAHPPMEQERTPTPTSMVLPIPLCGGSASSVRMVDMTSDPDFFERLSAAVTQPTLSSRNSTSLSAAYSDSLRGLLSRAPTKSKRLIKTGAPPLDPFHCASWGCAWRD
jgi:hypothetical protein